MTTFSQPTPRKGRTKAQRARTFLAADGKCHLCGRPIRDGERWQEDHVDALALGGVDHATNLKPAHVKCHVTKSGDDVRAVHKRNRIITSGNVERPRSRLSNSRFKQKMDGTVVDRATGLPVGRRRKTIPPYDQL